MTCQVEHLLDTEEVVPDNSRYMIQLLGAY